MRRYVMASILSWALIAIAPGTAEAQRGGFWRWWDSLSGPGPFNGIVYDQSIYSLGMERGTSVKTWFPDPTATKADPKRRYLRLGLQLGWLWAQKNPLTYAAPRDQDPPGVNAMPFAATADVGVAKGIDVGAAVGGVRFSGDGFGFTKFALTPRLSIRPAVLFSDNPGRRHEVLEIRFFATMMPGTIEADDFGAIGSFRAEGELLWGTTIALNVFALRR
jgi:hypothetical protein